MAMLANILTLTQDAVTKVASLAAGTSSAAIAVSPGRPFMISATGDFNIKGGATSAMSAAAATDFFLPGRVPFTFEASNDTAFIRVWNLDTVAIDVYVKVLGRT